MVLPNDLVSQFVKATNDSKQSKEETTVFGTTVEYEGRTYVRLDGSELLTPVSTTANIKPDERVTVMIKNHTAIVTGNVSSPAARTGDLADEITKVEVLVAEKASIDELNVQTGRIDELVADNVVIKEFLQASGADIGDLTATFATITEKLTAAEADIDKLETDKLDTAAADIKYATIENLNTTNADIHNLEATYGDFQVLTTNKLTALTGDINTLSTNKLDANTANITYAKISDLNATNSEITNLKSDVADIDTLIFGSASGDTIQASFANAVIAQLGNAQIKSAMIENISADKITAGDIITDNVSVKSENGLLLISDETIQIKDGTRVRVQIGKDAVNDYSINIWDAAGNLMFSQGGITDSAIKDAIIRNDMVSDTANIAAHKLDIDSLFEEINGSTKTIKSTRIYLDDKKQTLDVAFETLTSDVAELDETVTTQGTQITAIQGQISSKVWQQDINSATGELNTKYTNLEQEVDSVSATVANHTTQIGKKADSSTVTSVSNKVTQLETNLSGFQSTVSNTYATKTEVESIEIGGRNLFKGRGEEEIRLNDYNGVGGFTQFFEPYTFNPCETVGETYTISLWAKSPNGPTSLQIYNRNKDPRHFYFQPITLSSSLGTEWEYFTATVTNIDRGESYTDQYCNRLEVYAPNQLGVLVKKIKVEKGTKATDWTPAPEDVQANIDSAQAAAEAAQSTADQNAVKMATIISDFNADVANLQTQIDGSITTWFYEVAPTEANQPAVNWNTTDLKNIHLGDLYYDTITGYCYRWQVQNNLYSWQRITDTDVTKALSDAQAAQDTADQKRRVFYAQPAPPYDQGDLWVQGSGGDILRCKTAKISGQSYSSSDWIAASKYTDDTLATTANSNAIAAQNAASKAQDDIGSLTERVSDAESRITQTEKSIALTVTKTEVSNTYATKTDLSNSQSNAASTYATKTELSNSQSSAASTYATKTDLSNSQSNAASTYATKTELSTTQSELSSAIELKEDSILSSVSSTYATKTALNTTNSNVTKAQADIDGLEIGGRNLFSGYDDSEIQLNDYQGTGSFTQFTNRLTFNPCETVGETYTISFWAKSPNGSTPITVYNQNGQPRHFYFPRASFPNQLTDEWQYFTHTVVNEDRGESYGDTVCNRIEIYAQNQLGVLVKKIKVEKGNRATDWTPAPEDMATGADITAAQKELETVDERISVTESLIQQLSDSITMLVTDENGESLMVQTETGWTFSTSQIQSVVDDTSKNLDTLTNKMGDVDSTVNALKQAVEDLGVLNDYVKIGTYENEPCIELGESDSDFKLMITNTRIMFMQGGNMPAYINNQSLYIKKAVVEEEMQQGGFVWKSRANGNLGLVWKGVNN